MIKTPMMLLLSGDDARDKSLIDYSVADIAKQGFDAICLEFRDSKYNENDEIGREAIRYVEERSRANGMGFVIIMHHCSAWILEKHPDLRRKVTKGYSFSCCGDVKLPVPCLNGMNADRVVAAFIVERNEKGEVVKADNALPFVHLDGEVLYCQAEADAELLVYFEYILPAADYSHRDAEVILDEYLDIYKNYRLDGFALDEFGAGTRIADTYLCGEDFFAKFKAAYGYDFAEKLYLMDNLCKGTEFAKVRYDYFSLSNKITYDYQMAAKERFAKICPEDMFVGFHHTWFGEGNSGDLWSGAINYFELSDALSGGFVDAQYDSERTMNSLGLIAESVAKYSPTGMAYNMCWDRTTTPEKMDYFHRTLAVRNINWVGHAYSKTYSKNDDLQWFIYDFNSLKDTWGDVPMCIDREKNFSKFIGKLESKPKVAITYNWESCAYFNNDYMHYHRLSLKALADKLIINNIPADIIPSFETDLSQYEVIFVLWGTMMPRAQWEAVKTAAADGKKVYFIGPPVCVTTDGEDISREFEELTGCKIAGERNFLGGHEYVAWDLWFTNKRIQMKTYIDEKGVMDFRNENVRYYGYDLPLTDMFFNVLEELKPYQSICSNKVISKEFHGDGEHILTVTSRWQSRINENFTFCGHDFEIKNGLLVGIKIKDDKIEIISESGAQITVDGKQFEIKYI